MAERPQRKIRRPLSIALRMTAWYTLSAFSLIFVATASLYWVLVTNLEQEDMRILEDNLHNARLLLATSPPGVPPMGRASGANLEPAQHAQVYLRILDDAGRMLLETPGMSEELPLPTARDLSTLASSREMSRELNSRSGKLFRALSARIEGKAPEATHYVQVAIDRNTEDHVLRRYRERFWLVLGLSAVFCSAAGYLIARRGMRPVEDMGRTAEHIGSATLDQRMATTDLPAELSGLADTFNSMLDRLQESFSRIAQFSDDVAHELRTPVNALRGEIEVALGKARSIQEYRETLGSCLEECTRIARVIQSLLFLARGENEPPERHDIDVAKELATVQEFYEAAATDAGVQLCILAEEPLRASLDATLVQQAVANLVSNAIAHTPRGGVVQILAAGDESSVQITVTDTGCGIAAEHLPHVFGRFYRVDRARSRSRDNTGLGLALVKSIVERHGGRVEIHSEVQRGTQVKLIFPRHP